jgi:hypothetical protein
MCFACFFGKFTNFHNILILNNPSNSYKLSNITRVYGDSTPTKQYELDSDEDEPSNDEEE